MCRPIKFYLCNVMRNMNFFRYLQNWAAGRLCVCQTQTDITMTNNAALVTTMLLPPPRSWLPSKARFASTFLGWKQGNSIGSLRTHTSAKKCWHRYSTFLSTTPAVKDGILSVNGKDVLFDVPDNVMVTPLTNSAAFIGATSMVMASRHVFKLGLIR